MSTIPSSPIAANAVISTALTPAPASPAQAPSSPAAASPAQGPGHTGKPQAQPAPAAADQQTPAQDPGDYRLVIEDDKAAGSYVYKTIDRRTGEVVAQLPREQILKMREAFDYSAGDVINAKA